MFKRKVNPAWRHLPPEQVKLLQTLQKTERVWRDRAFPPVVAAQDAGLLQEALKIPLPHDAFYKGMNLAIQEGWTAGLQTIATCFDLTLREYEQCLLLTAAVQKDNAEMVEALLGGPAAPVDAIYAMAAISKASAVVREKALAVYLPRRGDAAVSILTYAVEHQPVLFARCLSLLPLGAKTPSALGEVARAALLHRGEGLAGQLELLAKSGMNPNHENGELLALALTAGDLKNAALILDCGFNLEVLGRRVLQDLYSRGAPPIAIDYLEQKLDGGSAAPKAAAAADEWQLCADDTLARVMPLPQGGHLTMLFNFALRQQILLHQPAVGAAAPPAVVPFAEVENRRALDDAWQRFRAMGGDGRYAEANATLRLRPQGGAAAP